MYPDYDLTDDDQSLDDEEFQRLLNMESKEFSDAIDEDSCELRNKEKSRTRRKESYSSEEDKIEDEEDVELQKRNGFEEETTQETEICPLTGLLIDDKQDISGEEGVTTLETAKIPNKKSCCDEYDIIDSLKEKNEE